MDWEYWQQSMHRKAREICILQFALTGCFEDCSKTYYLILLNLLNPGNIVRLTGLEAWLPMVASTVRNGNECLQGK